MEESKSKKLSLTITEDQADVRADIGLTQIGVFTSRSQIKKIFTDKKVYVNGIYVKPSYILQAGDEVMVELPAPEFNEELEPYDFPLDILFEDDHVIVLNKPAGLVVHPACGHYRDTLVNALLAHHKTLSKGSGPFRPGLVHRIDKDTSGLLVIAKTEDAHTRLAKQFHRKTVHRLYHAIVFGNFKSKSGTVTSYISRSPTNRKKFMATEEPIGKHAITHYQVLKEGPSLSLIQLKLETGRTHQIRVHMASLGNPVVGDETYGGKKRSAGSKPLDHLIDEMSRFALHAKELGFVHPGSHERMSFDSSWPEDLQQLLEMAKLQ